MTQTAVAVAATPNRSDAMLTALTLSPQAVPDTFAAAHQRIPSGRAYGGEILAHAVAAVEATTGPEWQIHSLHGYFLRGADVEKQSRYSVERIRDGRSFAVRTVTGEQDQQETFRATASSRRATPPNGPRNDSQCPELPAPESLPTSAEAVAGTAVRDTEYWARERNFDVRHVQQPVYVTAGAERNPAQVVWARAFSELPDDPAIHRQAIAYICDYTLLEPALRVRGAAWADQGLMTASIDHAMWFHAHGRADEWIALVQEAPHLDDELVTTRTMLYSRDRRLLATVAQQGLVRLPVAS